MDLVELIPEQYAQTFPAPRHVFATTGFAKLNAGKVDAVHYLCLTDGRSPRLGVILGEKGGELSCPFSAPFGAVDYRHPQHIGTIEILMDALREYRDGRPLRLTLPPEIYDPAMMPKVAFVASGRCSRRYDDINYHFETQWLEGYEQRLDSEARRKLRQARQSGFTAVWTDDAARAYRVIEQNRAERGFPLRMTLEQVEDTLRLVAGRCMVLEGPDGADAASAILYMTAPDIAQVIYWGSLERYNALRPMNLMAFEVFDRMRREGVRIVDLGPASSDGEPNRGLCEFKESVGAWASLKPTFYFE